MNFLQYIIVLVISVYLGVCMFIPFILIAMYKKIKVMQKNQDKHTQMIISLYKMLEGDANEK